ncbi:MAG: hypothetical protein ACPGO5_03500 [Patescibacteria group bacterium]
MKKNIKKSSDREGEFPERVDIKYLLSQGVKLPKGKKYRLHIGGWFCKFINAGRMPANRKRLFEASRRVTCAYPPGTHVCHAMNQAVTGKLIYVRPRSNNERREYAGDRFRAFVIWDDGHQSPDVKLCDIKKID